MDLQVPELRVHQAKEENVTGRLFGEPGNSVPSTRSHCIGMLF